MTCNFETFLLYDLGSAVEAAYGVDFDNDEEKNATHLFSLYTKKTTIKTLSEPIQ